MKIEYTAKDMEDVSYTVETAGDEPAYAWMVPGVVYDFDGASDEYGPTEYTPAQARAKAAALLRAADEAEGVPPRITLRDVPGGLLTDEARDHMRMHVYVNISATDRNPTGHHYRRAGYRKFVERDVWFGASDEQRAAALLEAANSVAQSSRHQATVEGQWPPAR